jgi:hypothetical protein
MLILEEATMQSEKRQYTTPKLTEHGTLEEVTKQINKTWGSSDGYLFQGVAITNVS